MQDNVEVVANQTEFVLPCQRDIAVSSLELKVFITLHSVFE